MMSDTSNPQLSRRRYLAAGCPEANLNEAPLKRVSILRCPRAEGATLVAAQRDL